MTGSAAHWPVPPNVRSELEGYLLRRCRGYNIWRLSGNQHQFQMLCSSCRGGLHVQPHPGKAKATEPVQAVWGGPHVPRLCSDALLRRLPWEGYFAMYLASPCIALASPCNKVAYVGSATAYSYHVRIVGKTRRLSGLPSLRVQVLCFFRLFLQLLLARWGSTNYLLTRQIQSPADACPPAPLSNGPIVNPRAPLQADCSVFRVKAVPCQPSPGTSYVRIQQRARPAKRDSRSCHCQCQPCVAASCLLHASSHWTRPSLV